MRVLSLLPLLSFAHSLAKQGDLSQLRARAIDQDEVGLESSSTDLQHITIYRRTGPQKPLPKTLSGRRFDSPAKTSSSIDPAQKTSQAGVSLQTTKQAEDRNSVTRNPRPEVRSSSGSQSSSRARPLASRARRQALNRLKKGIKPITRGHVSVEASRLAKEEEDRVRFSMDRMSRASKSRQAAQIGDILSSRGGSPSADRGNRPSRSIRRSMSYSGPEIEPGWGSSRKGNEIEKGSRDTRKPSPADSRSSLESAYSSRTTFRKLKRVQRELVRHAGRQRAYDEANTGAKEVRWTKTCAHAVTATGICLNIVPHIGYKIAGGGLAVAGIAAHHYGVTYANSIAVKHHLDSNKISDKEAYAKGQQVLNNVLVKPSQSVKEGTIIAGNTIADTTRSCYGAMCEAGKSLYASAASCIKGICRGANRGLNQAGSNGQQGGLGIESAGSEGDTRVAAVAEACAGTACKVGDAIVDQISVSLRTFGLRSERAQPSGAELV